MSLNLRLNTSPSALATAKLSFSVRIVSLLKSLRRRRASFSASKACSRSWVSLSCWLRVWVSSRSAGGGWCRGYLDRSCAAAGCAASTIMPMPAQPASRATPRIKQWSEAERGYFVTLAVCAPCFLNVRVGENSPSLWPTMFSVTNTELKIFAVVDQERVADEIRHDHGRARPGLDRDASRRWR